MHLVGGANEFELKHPVSVVYLGMWWGRWDLNRGQMEMSPTISFSFFRVWRIFY